MEQHELMSKTVAQLKLIAAEEQAEVPDGALKADIVAAIVKGRKEKATGAAPILLANPTSNAPALPPALPDNSTPEVQVSVLPSTEIAPEAQPSAIESEDPSVRLFLFKPKSGQTFAPMGVPPEGVVAEEGSGYEHHVGVHLDKLDLPDTMVSPGE